MTVETRATVSTDRGEHSRRAILDAALPVFRAHGYAAASLNQIIGASGLTKGGFYFHFPSKQALALAVLEDHQRRALEEVRREIGTHERAVDRLFATPRVIARRTEAGGGPAAMRKLTEELARDPDLRDVVCGSIRIWIEHAAEQFRAAQAEGTVRDDIDAATFAEVAVGASVGVQELSEQLGDGRLVERMESLVAMIQQAIAPPVQPVPPTRGE
jgi:TetR/AcrR family transcriptional repressor of nem operon